MCKILISKVVENASSFRSIVSSYFNFESIGVYNEDNVCVVDFSFEYCYKVHGELYPIYNVKEWKGDIYDHSGNLILSIADRIRLTKEVSKNLKFMRTNFSLDEFYADQVLYFVSGILNDYYASIRSFEQSIRWSFCLDKLKSSVIEKIQLDQSSYTYTEITIALGNICSKIVPQYMEILTEYGYGKESSYAMLEVVHRGNELVILDHGDWRIKDWKRIKELLSKNKESALISEYTWLGLL